MYRVLLQRLRRRRHSVFFVLGVLKKSRGISSLKAISLTPRLLSGNGAAGPVDGDVVTD